MKKKTEFQQTKNQDSGFGFSFWFVIYRAADNKTVTVQWIQVVPDIARCCSMMMI